MKANELRLGNYLQDREGRLCKVENLGDESFNIIGIDAPAIKGGLTSLPCRPITLTEEWLLKLGFAKTQMGFCVRYKHIEIYLSHDFKRLCLTFSSVDFSRIWLENKWTEVHQLQNLYFVLTGEELTIRP